MLAAPQSRSLSTAQTQLPSILGSSPPMEHHFPSVSHIISHDTLTNIYQHVLIRTRWPNNPKHLKHLLVWTCQLCFLLRWCWRRYLCRCSCWPWYRSAWSSSTCPYCRVLGIECLFEEIWECLKHGRLHFWHWNSFNCGISYLCNWLDMFFLYY